MMKDGLSRDAFAMMGDADEPETWKLPHHKRSISRAARGRLNVEDTVDWDHIAAAVAALSPGGFRGKRVQASAEEIIAAAKHLAAHYRHAGKPVPDTLQALIWVKSQESRVKGQMTPDSRPRTPDFYEV